MLESDFHHVEKEFSKFSLFPSLFWLDFFFSFHRVENSINSEFHENFVLHFNHHFIFREAFNPEMKVINRCSHPLEAQATNTPYRYCKCTSYHKSIIEPPEAKPSFPNVNRSSFVLSSIVNRKSSFQTVLLLKLVTHHTMIRAPYVASSHLMWKIRNLNTSMCYSKCSCVLERRFWVCWRTSFLIKIEKLWKNWKDSVRSSPLSMKFSLNISIKRRKENSSLI